MPPGISRAARWFQFLVMLFVAPLFLLLTNEAPVPSAGWAPIVLAGLFLIGWRMRLWVLKRLEHKAAEVPPASV